MRRFGPATIAVLDFLGNRAWPIYLESCEWAVRILSEHRPDARALRAGRWEFAPFYCETCEASFCERHWNPEPVMDAIYYDYTIGHCPQGHRQMIDEH